MLRDINNIDIILKEHIHVWYSKRTVIYSNSNQWPISI